MLVMIAVLHSVDRLQLVNVSKEMHVHAVNLFMPGYYKTKLFGLAYTSSFLALFTYLYQCFTANCTVPVEFASVTITATLVDGTTVDYDNLNNCMYYHFRVKQQLEIVSTQKLCGRYQPLRV